MNLLSILIPSIPSRSEQLNRLVNEINKQIAEADRDDIDVIIDDSARFLDGGLSIGKKREALVKRVTSEYCCFLDDDDEIAPNYISELSRLCKKKLHVCTFRSFAKLNGYWCLIDMNLDHKNNQEANPYNIIKRTAWHICPVRTEFARQYSFPDTNDAEDWIWFSQVIKHCKTQANSKAIIHQYNHITQTESDLITKTINADT